MYMCQAHIMTRVIFVIFYLFFYFLNLIFLI